MSREKSLAKNTLLLSVGTVVPKFAQFIVLPILTGYLTKTEYGTYDLIITLCALFVPGVTLQIQTAAFRFLIEKRTCFSEQRKVISNIMVFLAPIALLSFLVLFFALYRYSLLTRLLISAYFVLDIFFCACGQIARGLQQNRIYVAASVTSSLSNLLFIILFVYWLRWGINGTLLCMLAAAFFPLLLFVFVLRLWQYIDIRLFDFPFLKELLAYSWPMVPNSLSMWIMNASDKVVVSLFLGIEANAIYAVAKKIPNIITIFQSTFTMAWQESASLACTDKDSGEYYSQMFDTVFCMMAGMMAVLTACMPLLFRILIRGDYDNAYYQMPILVMGMFFFSIASYMGGIYVAKKQTKSVAMTTLFAAFINLVTDLLMIRYIGVYAASVSTLLSYIFLAFYRMSDIRNYTEIRYDKPKVCLVLLLLVFVCACSYVRAVYMYFLEFAFAVGMMLILNKKIIVSLGKSMLAKAIR